MRLFIRDPVHPRVLEEARQHFQVIDWRGDEEQGRQAEAVIVRTAPMKAGDIDRYPNLRLISKHGAGTDNIDLAYARQKGIPVTNTPGANSNSVAELIVGLMLALSRNMLKADRMTRAGLERWTQPALAGFELHGKRIGLVGLGKIGQRTGEILREGFGCTILGYDPYLPQEVIRKMTGITLYNDLNELLMECDYLSLSVPLTDQTRNLIDREQLALMKPTAYLINTARGAVVNEEALARALAQKALAGAALDVFEKEPPSPHNPLMLCENFIATPHLGAATDEALIRMGMCALEQAIKIKEGQAPDFVVNR